VDEENALPRARQLTCSLRAFKGAKEKRRQKNEGGGGSLAVLRRSAGSSNLNLEVKLAISHQSHLFSIRSLVAAPTPKTDARLRLPAGACRPLPQVQRLRQGGPVHELSCLPHADTENRPWRHSCKNRAYTKTTSSRGIPPLPSPWRRCSTRNVYMISP